jgi:light-regulated signal transduction histidine kinase (bacteriophytochrome)
LRASRKAEWDLQKAKLELEAANKELEAFSYSVSHDLRSPLRSIDGFSLAVLEDFGELLPGEGRRFLENVRSSAQRMGELIDDLLKLSQVSRAEIHAVPVDLTRLAEKILTEFQRNHPERTIRFRITPNLNAHGDARLLQVVLENLLNNAWKYTSRQEQAEIEFGARQEDGRTIFFVHDNGAGFDMAYAGKLFGAFQRLHGMTEFPGTGIGLATVQRIIHRHGGRIWAEGVVDGGATFFFTLPAPEGTEAGIEIELREEAPILQRAREIV